MGLDMYVYKTKQELPAPVGFVHTPRASYEEYPGDYKEDWWTQAEHKLIMEEDRDEARFYYWRKHPDLHGWFGGLYAEKAGVDDDSNGNPNWGKASEGNFSGPVQIVAEDLDRLQEAVDACRLPHTEGFFFGKSNSSEVAQAEDRLFIAKAREALAEGWNLFLLGQLVKGETMHRDRIEQLACMFDDSFSAGR